MKISYIIVSTLFLFTFVGCAKPPLEEVKIVGVWKVEEPIPGVFVYNFNKDHTWSLRVPGNSGDAVGTWSLQDDKLTTSMGAISNQFGLGNIFGATSTSITYRIAKLNQTTMIWRESGKLAGITLKRSQPTSRTTQP